MRAVYTANLIVLHVITRKSTNHEAPHYEIVSITLPVPLPSRRQIQPNFAPTRNKEQFVILCTVSRAIAGLYTQLHKTGAMFFYGVTQGTFQGHNPSLIQAPLPALNPFRWILKIPGFMVIKYSSRTQKTGPPPLFMQSICPPYKLSV
jgi:hypothetical protein